MFEKIKKIFYAVFKKEKNKILLLDDADTNDLQNKDSRSDFTKSIKVEDRRPVENVDFFNLFVKQFETCNNYKDFKKMIENKRKNIENMT